MYSTPTVYGMSQFQRNPKAIFSEENAKTPVFISHRGHISHVLLKEEAYSELNNELIFWKNLAQQNKEKNNEEDILWKNLAEDNCENIWNDKDDIYETML